MEFQPEKQTAERNILLLQSNAETKKNYPFDFEFRIRYQIFGDELSTEYMVTNTGTGVDVFFCGRTSGFSFTPGLQDTVFSDYHLQFEETENLPAGPFRKTDLFKSARSGIGRHQPAEPEKIPVLPGCPGF